MKKTTWQKILSIMVLPFGAVLFVLGKLFGRWQGKSFRIALCKNFDTEEENPFAGINGVVNFYLDREGLLAVDYLDKKTTEEAIIARLRERGYVSSEEKPIPVLENEPKPTDCDCSTCHRC